MRVVQMLESEEIVKRLVAMRGTKIDDRDVKFYRQIAKNLTGPKSGMGVLMCIQRAIADHVQQDGYPVFMSAVLQFCIPDCINALIDDEEVKAEAMDCLKEIKS